MPVWTFRSHGVKRVCETDDPSRTGDLFHVQPVRVAAAVAALMMVTNHFWHMRPGELHSIHNLVPDYGVVRHLAELVLVQLAWLAKQSLVHRNLADIVQETAGANSCHFCRFQSHRFADSRRVTSYAQ